MTDIIQSKIDFHSTTDRLGGRFALYDPEALTGSAKSLYDHARSKIVPEAERVGFTAMLPDGRFVGPFNPMLASPDISAAMLALQKTERERTALDEKTRQVVILSVGAVLRAPYERYAHAAEARAAGWSTATIDALVLGEDAPELRSIDRVAQLFTLQLVGDLKIDDEVFEQARTTFAQKGIVDLILLIGCYQLVCSMLNAIAIPVPTEGDY